MEKIYHPVSGECGYFAAIIHDYSINQLVLTSANSRGVCDE